MSTPTWNEVPDPGGPANNRIGDGYEVRKGYVIVGPGPVLAVGDVFTAIGGGGPTHTVASIALGGAAASDYVMFGDTGGTTINELCRYYARTWAASTLSIAGPQFPE